MSNLTINEGAYTDLERDLIENEPPGLFPSDQSSVWGQVRSVYAAYLQTFADLLTLWYANLDPATVSDDDLPEWEFMLGLPVGNATVTPVLRRANIQSRFQRGAFTRTRRAKIVESFIIATFGAPTLFDAMGLALSSSGIPMFSGIVNLSGTYTIVEDVPNFTYKVYVLSSLSVDVTGLTRELTRITPSGISFTIAQVPALPISGVSVMARTTVTGTIKAKKFLGTGAINARSIVSGIVTK